MQKKTRAESIYFKKNYFRTLSGCNIVKVLKLNVMVKNRRNRIERVRVDFIGSSVDKR